MSCAYKILGDKQPIHAMQHRPCNLQRPFATSLLHVKPLTTLPKANKRVAGRQCHVRASSATQADVPAELSKIVNGFQMVPDPKIKYQQLLFYAKKLKPMAAALHTEENKVQGCVSQVWVHPRVEGDQIFWEADSDSALTKGLAALLVQGLSGSTAAQIVAIPPDFINTLGLQQSLTPSRNNGFLNMFRLMQRKSLELVQREQHTADEAAAMPKPVPADAMSQQLTEASHDELKAQEVQEDEQAQTMAAQPSNGAASTSQPMNPQMNGGSVQAVQTKLQEALKPSRLQVQQESHQQVRNQQTVSNENYFKISVVSEKFEGMSKQERQTMVEQILGVSEGQGVLTLIAQTPAEASEQ